MQSTTKLTFSKGMDISADAVDVPANRAHDILNLDLTQSGVGFARDEYTAPTLLAGARCLQGFDAFGLCASGDTLYRIDVPLAVTPVHSGLHPTNPIAYVAHAGRIWFTDGVRVGMFNEIDNSASWVGLPVPGAPAVRAVGVGGLTPGAYGLAFSFMSATEESGISSMVTVHTQAGLELTQIPVPPSGCDLRVYMTMPDGDILYHLMDIPNGLMAPFLIGSAPEGKQAMNRFLSQLPGGRLLAGYNGRMYVARGSVLYFSEPLYYGLTSLRDGYIMYESEITVLLATEGGLYVGTRDHVHYLSGDGPNAAKTKLSAPPPVPWSGTPLVAGQLTGEHVKRGGIYALWLSALGYYLGTPDGLVVPMQSDRIQGITDTAISSATLATRGINRVVTTVE